MKYRTTAILASALFTPATLDRFPLKKKLNLLSQHRSQNDSILENLFDSPIEPHGTQVSLLQHRLSVDKAAPRHAIDHPQRSNAQEANRLGAKRPPLPSHAFPGMHWDDVETKPAMICSVVLFLAGVLCSAGGIGGGGIYVTVLMVAGQLIPHDAVPLSKAVVFFGSLSSLALNVRKTLTSSAGGQAKTLIDYNICRLVVPGALVGTLFGVVLNSLLSSWVIVALLSAILCTMTVMALKKLHEQWIKEQAEELKLGKLNSEPAAALSDQNDAASRPGGGDSGASPEAPLDSSSKSKEAVNSGKLRGVLMRGEGVAWFCLLILIISCGTLHAHASMCYEDIAGDVDGVYGREVCMRPVIKAMVGQRLAKWMQMNGLAQFILYGFLGLPIVICASLLTFYTGILVTREDWKLEEAYSYIFMSLFTGCFAGLVGIGGGLVFSPFFLWMGVEPPIAVATSSTCVIFTSSSTTFQYLLTDRIILALTAIYGLVNLIASYVGTSLVHALQDRYHTKQSHITAIVCLGVLTSVVLSVGKLLTMGVTE